MFMSDWKRMLNISSASSKRRKLFSVGVLAIIFILIFSAGFFIGKKEGFNTATENGKIKNRGSSIPTYLSKDVDFRIFWEVWDLLQKDYVERPISDPKLFYGALKGLVAGVDDPYTVFFDPKTASDFTQELSGSFEGIGAEIGLRDNEIVVIAPLPGTPAEKAGVVAGDAILTIDDIETSGMTLEDAVSKIRGPKGSIVSLKLARGKNNEEVLVKVTRDTITVESVNFEMKSVPNSKVKDIAYIRISHFNEDTVGSFDKAVASLFKENARAIILDLRNNPGGFLDSAVTISSQWVDSGSVVIEKSKGDKKIEHPASGLAKLKGVKTVVLVNEGSASASEIVAGALQDYGLATLIGTKTFGKGSVQELQQLSDGSAVKITVAEWLTPKGRSINKLGIEPDIVAPVDYTKLKEGEDPQLIRALELLR